MIRFNNSENKKLLIFFSNLIRKIFGGDRIKRISNIILNLTKKISKEKGGRINILDFGCGSMEVSKKLKDRKFIKKIIGTDTFKFKYKVGKLTYLDSKKFFKNNTIKFDVVLTVDVLHHINVEKASETLKKLSKISKQIIVKDHFEYGFFSRHLLRFVDFYANYAYGVTIPKRYFDQKLWKQTVKKSGLKEVYFIKNFQQHDGLFNLILNRRHHFVSVLKPYGKK